MKTKLIASLIMILCSTLLASTSLFAGKNDVTYEVTITNLTRGQRFTPILVASHKPGVKLFKLGTAASTELTTQSEGGNPGPLMELLASNPKVIDVTHSAGLLDPGASVTVVVDANGAKQVSLSSMMIPTNDGFLALNGVVAPVGNKTVMYLSPAYDVGSEPNDELCLNIPGPDCAAVNGEAVGEGEGVSPNEGGEGYVHVHAGIHGIGDLPAEDHDWRNPVARITITRTN